MAPTELSTRPDPYLRRDVGLPPGVIGNSEVGHQNIGAGRVVNQELLRINTMIHSGEFFQNNVLLDTIAHVKTHGTYLHLMGLASDAGVHSSLEHLYGLLTLAKANGLKANQVLIHNFSDGRDCQPDLGIQFCEQIEAKLKEIGIGQIASVVGRYYAMDRDDRWERVEVAYRLLTEGVGDRVTMPQMPIATITRTPMIPTAEEMSLFVRVWLLEVMATPSLVSVTEMQLFSITFEATDRENSPSLLPGRISV